MYILISILICVRHFYQLIIEKSRHDHAYMVIVYYFKLEVSRRRANTMGKNKKKQIQVKDAVVVVVVVGSFGPIEPAARYATLIPHTHTHAYALTHTY